MNYVALGDCVTLGAPLQKGIAYPERVAKALGWQVTNYGHTMSSTREGLQYFKKTRCASRRYFVDSIWHR